MLRFLPNIAYSYRTTQIDLLNYVYMFMYTFNSVALIIIIVHDLFLSLHTCIPAPPFLQTYLYPWGLARRRGNTQVLSMHRCWNASCLQLNQHYLSSSIPLVFSPRFVTLYNMHYLPNCHCLHCQLSVGDSIDKCGMHAVLVDMRREGGKVRGREGGREE